MVDIGASLMVQGSGSDSGKSLIVAGLVRLFVGMGFRAVPFKPQNMSNNAAVASDGLGEIGRAQAMQADAGGIGSSIHMNPILLKPQGDGVSQIIVQGRYWGEASARDYYDLKPRLMPFIEESFLELCSKSDIVIVEGAGSPSEVNLRNGDMANMGFAVRFGVPVVMLGDIERGGVIANMVGTYHVLDEGERSLIRGYIINKFRGDSSLFLSGVEAIGEFTGWDCLGILPWLDGVSLLSQEDALGLESIKSAERDKRVSKGDGARIRIGVLRLLHIANFDDLDALRADDGVDIQLIESGMVIGDDLDCVIICGSKSTILDYEYLCENGWDVDICAYVRRGGVVLGLCGGYQMLGKSISDPHGIESKGKDISALGLLDVETVLHGEKDTLHSTARDSLFNCTVSGYEIHIGKTTINDSSNGSNNGSNNGSSNDSGVRVFLTRSDGEVIGVMNNSGRVMGCYLHGLFANDDFRYSFLSSLRCGYTPSHASHGAMKEQIFSRLAEHIQRHCDIDKLMDIAGI